MSKIGTPSWYEHLCHTQGKVTCRKRDKDTRVAKYAPCERDASGKQSERDYEYVLPPDFYLLDGANMSGKKVVFSAYDIPDAERQYRAFLNYHRSNGLIASDKTPEQHARERKELNRARLERRKERKRQAWEQANK